MRQGFIFDQNKCVGCFACVVACQIENANEQHQPWREITTFNSFQHPQLPVFNFSLACNHCEDAPCEKYCPALAYTKDSDLNIIIHHANRCMGCKYCTWTCPYDAPKFIASEGVVEKCTLCTDRLNIGLKPACANLCPTGALDYDEIEDCDFSSVIGFTNRGAEPGIQIIPPRKKNIYPENNQKLSPEEETLYKKLIKQSESKVNLQIEWTLVVFTLLTALLTSLIFASVYDGFSISPWIFLSLGMIGFYLSSIHLGKKMRAWRSILNIYQSWLSREIFFFGLFLFLGTVYFLNPASKSVGYTSAIVGFLTLLSIDKVYKVAFKTTPFNINSASILLSGLLLTTIWTGVLSLFLMLVIIKLCLYLYRKHFFYTRNKKYYLGVSLTRIVFGLLAPVIFSFTDFENYKIVIMLFVFIGELIDRLEYYYDLDIITPSKQIEKILLNSE